MVYWGELCENGKQIESVCFQSELKHEKELQIGNEKEHCVCVYVFIGEEKKVCVCVYEERKKERKTERQQERRRKKDFLKRKREKYVFASEMHVCLLSFFELFSAPHHSHELHRSGEQEGRGR